MFWFNLNVIALVCSFFVLKSAKKGKDLSPKQTTTKNRRLVAITSFDQAFKTATAWVLKETRSRVETRFLATAAAAAAASFSGRETDNKRTEKNREICIHPAEFLYPVEIYLYMWFEATVIRSIGELLARSVRLFAGFGPVCRRMSQCLCRFVLSSSHF